MGGHQTRSRHSPKASALGGRAIHLVDIENLCVNHSGQPISTGVGDSYRSIVRPGPNDQFIVASDASRIFDARREFQGARIVHGTGPDGAELAIEHEVDLRHAATHFTTLVIASGDGYFTRTARRAQELDMRVVVVSRESCLARSLAHYAHGFIAFPDLNTHASEFTTAS